MKQEYLGEEMAGEFSLQSMFHAHRVLQHAVKSYDMGPMALLPL
jgi:hypothetical protein